jgi:hypothetical protein
MALSRKDFTAQFRRLVEAKVPNVSGIAMRQGDEGSMRAVQIPEFWEIARRIPPM